MKKIIAGLFMLSSVAFAGADIQEVVEANYSARYVEMEQNPIEAVIYYKKALTNTTSDIMGGDKHSSLIVNYKGDNVVGVFIIDRDSTLIIKANPEVYPAVGIVLLEDKVQQLYMKHIETGSVM